MNTENTIHEKNMHPIKCCLVWRVDEVPDGWAEHDTTRNIVPAQIRLQFFELINYSWTAYLRAVK